VAVLAGVAFVLAQRATFDPRPLTLQDRRIVISRNAMVNLLHTNVFFPLYRSYQDRQELAKFAATRSESPAKIAADFSAAAAMIPGSEAVTSPEGYTYMAQTLMPDGTTYLRRRPKHVVLIFMESYARWVLDYEDGGLGADAGATYRRLRGQSLAFMRHFSPAGGTIKNIASAIYSFPVTRNFYPSIVYHPEGYKPFPGRLPGVMASLGFEPRFFYGGVIAWHRLYQFLPQVGFQKVFAEHSDDTLPRHENGLFDGDLFKLVDRDLAARRPEDPPTFSFVMTLTNHPPYLVPAGAELPPIKLPPTIADRLIDDPEQIMRRLVAFRYADRSLGAFLEAAAQRPYFNDTLFVITGDHSFTSGIGFGPEWGWKMEQIPFLIYSPGLLRPEFAGKEVKAFTTHLDIMPTLAALVAPASGTKPPQQLHRLHTWGKNMLAPGPMPVDDGINQYFSCYQKHCLKDGQLYRLNDAEFFEVVPADAAAADLKKTIERRDAAYFDSGMHYFFRFQAAKAAGPAGNILQPSPAAEDLP
jgi:phosphoglycerol transferase MdoB-like AlkP superfamily enzyme